MWMLRESTMVAVILLSAGPALAQQGSTPREVVPEPVTAPAPGSSEQGAQPSGTLVLLFGTGSAALTPENQAILDQASRLYREGRPILMTVTGSTDAVGIPEQNLLLSQRRANAVVRGLLARGLPAERCQVLAKGETNPVVPTPRGVPEPQNRRVEITWR